MIGVVSTWMVVVMWLLLLCYCYCCCYVHVDCLAMWPCCLRRRSLVLIWAVVMSSTMQAGANDE